MPAINMAGDLTVPANPGTGKFVLMSPFSGPKGSPFDAQSANGYTANGVGIRVADPTNYSTGALNTGIGYDAEVVIGPTAPQSIKDAGFTDDYTPGVTYFTTATTPQAITTSVLMAIGGGKSTAAVNGIAPTVPYTAGFQMLGFGGGGSRDAGAGPAFTGFGLKMVTATASVAVGAAIETGFLNRGVRTMVSGESAFGSATAASATIT